jgi:L-lysine exporter family protein LysE/ArgO
VNTTTTFLQGWLMTAGLIAAIGAQNAFVLRQGLTRAHVGPVVLLCTLSDWLLIVAGVYGVGAWVQSSPVLLQAFRYGGAAFVFIYGLGAARRAWRPDARGLVVASAAAVPARLGATLAATLALTYLNPHVYLDTMLLLGTVGAQHEGSMRVAFVVGAGLASAMWFGALGFGAAAASRRLQGPSLWRIIDGSVAVVMFGVALQLLLRPL